MPELPEVETVSKALNISITNYIIKKVEVFKPNLRVLVSKNINVISKDSTIFSVKRRAKYGKIYLDNEYVIVFHLGMSGRIIIDRPESYVRQKHDHIVFHLKSSKATKKDIRLIFNDPRRFGFLNVYKNNSLDFKNIFKELGPEPLTANFNTKALQNILFKRVTSIKSVLLNQKLIAGLGNIYVCESLFASKISPYKKASDLTEKEIKTLLFKIKLVLKKAIRAGGSTIKDHKNINGEIGYFQNSFLVYDREGKICKNKFCNEKIKRIVQNGRSTFHCSNCQS
jgi:formamidopyrimidine-DNA glycosylase